MFSQFRQAVESLSQPPPRQSQDHASSPDRRSRSPDPENAIMNLRKSITAHRTASPGQQNTGSPIPRPTSPSPLSTAKSAADSASRKTTLEERLRASFVVSDSSGTTPIPSTGSPPTPRAVPVSQHPLSPTLVPLPDSPVPARGATLPALDTAVGGPVQAEESKDTNDALSLSREPNAAEQPPNMTPPTDPQDTVSLTACSMDGVPTDSSVGSCVEIILTHEAPEETNAESEHRNIEVAGVIGVPTVDTESSGAEPESVMPGQQQHAGVEVLQQRLKLVEQRFADISTSFKKLQVERRDIDNVICELTPLSESKDIEVLREYLINVNMKIELGQDELQRLNGKLTRQEERSEELRGIHRLETASQSDQIEKLQRQLNEAETLITASQSTALQAEEVSAKRDSDIEQLRAEAVKANETAKEEEEKRVKATSWLKTVRQKLVKAEKERDDALRELNEMKDRNLEERDKNRTERANLEREVDAANTEREKMISGLRAQFDKDISAAKDRAERDIQTAKKQFDAEMNALKTSHNAEISAKKLRLDTLENTVVNLASENKSFFEQMELRQAELESSQYNAESLQARNTELQFQLKELQERLTLLNDEVSELRGEHETRLQVPGASAEEISQLVSSIELKYEARLSELKKTLTTAEKERTEVEANWSQKLTEKTRETEELKRKLQSSVQLRERDENMTGSLKAEIEKLQTEARTQHGRLHELQTHNDAFKDAESILHRRLSEAAARAEDSDKQLDESKSRETQLRAQNKTLWDELRKIQNSVAILERQRNPGARYWISRSEVTDSQTSISTADAPASSPARNQEEINHEYLRNVILQFLEHKEMRPNLVRVLSTILHFTPQETRRLMSKV